MARHATMAAAASQRGLAARGLAAVPTSLDSIPGHRSRAGSMDCGSSRSEATLRPSFSVGPLISAHLHAEPLAQEPARAMQLRFAGALGDPEHLRGLGM